MPTDPAITLAQMFSPAFPVGAFAFSHGLETVIAEGVVTDAASLSDWLTGLLRHGAGRNDAILLGAAYRGEAYHGETCDTLARALAPAKERRDEMLMQGRAFASTASAVWGITVTAECYPVAVGEVAAALSLPLPATAEFYTHAFTANLISAAVRLIPIGQTDGQRILAALGPDIAAAAQGAADGLDALGSAGFAAEIAAMRHETQNVRLFRT